MRRVNRVHRHRSACAEIVNWVFPEGKSRHAAGAKIVQHDPERLPRSKGEIQGVVVVNDDFRALVALLDTEASLHADQSGNRPKNN